MSKYNIEKNDDRLIIKVTKAIKILRDLNNYKNNAEVRGICAILMDAVGERPLDIVLHGVNLWPKFSGSYNYPVPTGTAKQRTDLIANNGVDIYWGDAEQFFKNPMGMFDACISKWGDHYYGDLRREMCAWLADYTEEYLRLMLEL